MGESSVVSVAAPISVPNGCGSRPQPAPRPWGGAALAVVLAVAGWLLAGPALAGARYAPHEIRLAAATTYDAAGSPNPFRVAFAAELVAPSGRRVQVPGFFDGDGNGGGTGRTFAVRVSPDEEGTWTWRSSSSDPSLAGRSGSFAVSGALSGRFAQGPVEVDPARPRFFRQRDGGPIFLLGKFLDDAAPSAALRYSHTFFADAVDDATREAMLARHLAMGLNKINVYVANRGDYGGVATTPWLGAAASPRHDRFDLQRWHAWEAWMDRLLAAGLVAQLWLFADDSGFGDLPEPVRKDLVAFTMARLSAYPNVVVTLALEWQEGWTEAEVEDHARYLQERNPWGRLVTVHGVTGVFAFPDAPWCDFLDLQGGNDGSPEQVRRLGLDSRALAEKPLLQEEHGLGDEDDANRRRAWAALTSGAAGIGTGAFLAHLGAFVAAVPFAELHPVDGLTTAGTAWVLAEAGRTYVAYAPYGGPFELDLGEAPGSFDAVWFDPRRGTWSGQAVVAGGGAVTFAPPGPGDWALVLRARNGSAPPRLNGPLPQPFPLFPPDHWWNLAVAGAPVDPAGAVWLQRLGAAVLRPAFGGDLVPLQPGDPLAAGIPYAVVGGNQPKVRVTFLGAPAESDRGFPAYPLQEVGYPIPAEARTQPGWIEGGHPGEATVAGERRMILVDADHRTLYELRGVRWSAARNRWEALTGAAFSLDSNDRRPAGWWSAAESGLEVFPGLLRFDEIWACADPDRPTSCSLRPEPLRHALAVTVAATDGHVFPASRSAAEGSGALPLGARLRLRPGTDLSRFPADVRKIFQAMKDHGLIVAGVGPDLHVQGTYDPRWDTGALAIAFATLRASDFEVVQRGWRGPARSVAGAADFYSVAPCRLLDTRQPAGPAGSPALAPPWRGAALGERPGLPDSALVPVSRVVRAGGVCGIPRDAVAIAANVTVVTPPGEGHVTAFPGDAAAAGTSLLNFSAAVTRANHAVIPLAGSGSGTFAMQAFSPAGPLHVVVDVSGYFRRPPR